MTPFAPVWRLILETEQPPRFKFITFAWRLLEFCFLFSSPRTHMECDNYRLRQLARSACFFQSARFRWTAKQTSLSANLTKNLLVPLGFSRHIILHFHLRRGFDVPTKASKFMFTCGSHSHSVLYHSLFLVYLKTEILSWNFEKQKPKVSKSSFPT